MNNSAILKVSYYRIYKTPVTVNLQGTTPFPPIILNIHNASSKHPICAYPLTIEFQSTTSLTCKSMEKFWNPFLWNTGSHFLPLSGCFLLSLEAVDPCFFIFEREREIGERERRIRGGEMRG
ncbi:unnamed protein product [Vicia faba]|uniref:Uncharacterized protein n=1 Tax=Vicia faba TaxID=3906 RepID=A0AAV0ZJR0_VICFA|nr:unnamed protein product [Vicia faba]